MAVYAFAYQIYCDFSGYSDIARGAAKLMGFELMVNFDRPYLATNPPEFWRRWHISLSRWLRDYLYIPLGGSHGGPRRTYRNLMLTMLLGGLWHGAAWTFVAWGAYHGLLLVAHRLFARDRGAVGTPLGRQVARVLWFHAVCYGWLLFRARDLGQARTFTGVLLTGAGGFAQFHPQRLALLLFLVACLGLVELWTQNAPDAAEGLLARPGFRPALCSLLVLALIVLTPPGSRSFIYFQF